MQEQIEFWLRQYQEKYYVRWTIIDKSVHQAVGSIELFNRKAADYFNNCGLLRLDLRSDYEREKPIFEILTLLLPSAFELFECEMIATKVPTFAQERKAAVMRYGFSASSEVLIGSHDNKEYTDYYVLGHSFQSI